MQYHNIQCASANLIPWNESCNLRKGKSRNSAYMFMNRQPRIEEGAVLPVITLQAIDETIENLGYRNQKGTKSRLVQAIRAHYEHDDSILFVKSIDSDSLIRVLWANAFDPITIRNRRRNLSSIKSSVNADFKKLYREGKNPEGITISSSNTLVMSDEAKDSALEALRGGVDMEGAGRLGQLAGALNTLKDALSSSENLGELSKGQEPAVLHELRDLIGGLSEKIGVAGTGLPGDGGTTGGKSEDNSRIEALEKVRVSPETWLAEHSDFMGSDGGTASFPSESKGIADAADIETEEVEVPEETASEGDFEEVEEIDDTDTLEITDNPEIEEEEVLDVAEVEDEISEAEPIADLEGIADAADIETEEVEVPEEAALEGDFEEVDGEGLEEIEASEESEALDEEVCEEAPAEEAFETIEAGDEVEEEEGSVGDIDSSEFTDDFREVGLLSKAVESGRLLEDLDEKNLSVGPGANQNRDNARLLSEKFNHSLAAMDRFFNQYVLIPRGIYPVGKTRPGTNEREKLHLDLAEFYMGKFPVTNALFEIFAEKTGYKSTAESVGYGTVYYGRIQREVDEETGLETVNWSSSLTSRVVDGACWYQPLGPGSTLHTKRNHPVVQVSLEDALAFAAWTGKSLPTEDEWEAASRTAVGNLFPWGTRWEKDACNIEDTSAGRTTPVDQFMEWENDLGVADTLGNVWEWTSTALMDTSESSGKCYIAKGGSWVTGKSLDLVSRFKLEPQSHSNILGFRCVAV